MVMRSVRILELDRRLGTLERQVVRLTRQQRGITRLRLSTRLRVSIPAREENATSDAVLRAAGLLCEPTERERQIVAEWQAVPTEERITLLTEFRSLPLEPGLSQIIIDNRR